MRFKLLPTTILGGGILGATALAAYTLFVRPWHLRWGATDDELKETLPGDEVMPDAGIQVTHAITINAPAEDVWKWLIQMGQGRGGFYSYDELENLFGLDIHNINEIMPELQSLKEGDFIRSARKGWLGGRFDDVAGWFVARLEPNQALILRDEIERGSWAFVLKPIGDKQTRLIVRVRGPKPETFGRTALNYSVFEPAHFIMERKMLLTLKKLAERKPPVPQEIFSGGYVGLEENVPHA